MEVTNNTKANWQALLSALQDVSGDQLETANVKDVSLVTNDAGLTITFNTVVDGKEVPITLSMMPELDAPEGVADGTVVAELLKKLDEIDISSMTKTEAAEFMQKFIDKLSEKIDANGGLKTTSVPKADGTTGSATIFNLLEILTLLVEVGQEIKNSAKQIKAADNELQAQAYERQADKTIAMAEAAKSLAGQYLAISICMMAVSAAVTVGAGIYGATKANLPDTKAQGVTANMAKEIQNTQPEQLQIGDITTKSGTEAAAALGDSKVQDIKTAFIADRSIANAKAEMVNAEAELTNQTNNLAQARQTLDEAQTAYDAAVETNNAIPDNDPGKQAAVEAVQDKAQKLETAKTKYAEAQAQRDTAQARLDQCSVNFRDAVMNVMDRYSTAYTGASKADQPEKLNELKVATELGMKMLKGEKIPGSDKTILNDVAFGKIVTNSNTAYRNALAGERNWKTQVAGQIGQFLGSLSTTLSQYWQSDVNYKAQAEQADAQRLQAEATRKQNEYEEDKNLESSGQNIIDNALQTMNKIYEGQHETNRQIFS